MSPLIQFIRFKPLKTTKFFKFHVFSYLLVGDRIKNSIVDMITGLRSPNNQIFSILHRNISNRGPSETNHKSNN